MARLYVGLSGFSYKEWQGEDRFYPPKLKASHYFEFYRSRYPAVEMDGSWYRMPGKDAVEKYIGETEKGFRFSFKAHRKITHMARLKPEAIDPLQFMLWRIAPLAVADRLGPLLVQLPPNMKRDDVRLGTFLEQAPKFYPDPNSAGWKEPAYTTVPVRYAFEFRHDSWDHDDVEALLREFNAGWVVADTDDKDGSRRVPGDFVYVRMRKTEYSSASLDEWVQWLISQEKDAYVYCKHEDAEEPWVWADHLIASGGSHSVRSQP